MCVCVCVRVRVRVSVCVWINPKVNYRTQCLYEGSEWGERSSSVSYVFWSSHVCGSSLSHTWWSHTPPRPFPLWARPLGPRLTGASGLSSCLLLSLEDTNANTKHTSQQSYVIHHMHSFLSHWLTRLYTHRLMNDFTSTQWLQSKYICDNILVNRVKKMSNNYYSGAFKYSDSI